ncbi:MAG TPA: trehalose-6-phosphate synthase [Rhodocyclaceae bacterium]|nr:trehalose-6-phosphate synthase [Rhodocyclaceae bacterium]
MRLSLRFALPLLLVLAVFFYVLVPLVDQLTMRWSMRDLDNRSALLANTIQEPLQTQFAAGSHEVVRFFHKLALDGNIDAIAFCPSANSVPLSSGTLPREIRCSDLDRWVAPGARLIQSALGPLHVSIEPMPGEGMSSGRLIFVHSMSFIAQRSEEIRRYIAYVFATIALVVSLLTVSIAHLSLRGWVAGIRTMLRTGRAKDRAASHVSAPEFKPVARDLQKLISEIEEEYRARDEGRIQWSPDALRAILQNELRSDDVIVVSNREPYVHQHVGDHIEVQRPASGLVTAVEPIMRACSGTWIAHGSGSADRATVDEKDRVGVPPEKHAYLLRRIWLTPEEEAGYYFGFANEGLWPLCHIAHVRPVFRSADWAHYVSVNRKFADAVVAEAKSSSPIVLVQDYHFALLPRMIRERLPDATIITFWHIPWPNPESFAICPWRDEILAGLLGSNILGFHTQFHCNNFVDTVDRSIEARVDRESFTVTLGRKVTAVRRYPISIAWPPEAEASAKPVPECRAEIRRINNIPDSHVIGVGVDRLDYTKGILERFRAVERLLELHPEWIGRFTFIQIAAPSRSGIVEYQHHAEQVRQLVECINERFSRPGTPPPILLKVEHHDASQVYAYYRAAEFCFVSSLHDGMNLVAKEFIAARDDEQGVLVLSQFTGAARELPEALIINPYDADQCAAALNLAMTMSADEQRERMRLMRGLVSEYNVYRWIGRMLTDANIMLQRSRLTDHPETLSPDINNPVEIGA